MIPRPRNPSQSPPIGLSLLLPGFPDTPYLSTRIEPDLHHILLLPREWPLYSQLNVAFRQAEANRLPTYFVITPDTCLWMQPSGSVLRRLQCNWYDEEDRRLHYVPGFHALDHVCGE